LILPVEGRMNSLELFQDKMEVFKKLLGQ